jgi:RNA polymerase sigma factor (TIGR02999 family)
LSHEPCTPTLDVQDDAPDFGQKGPQQLFSTLYAELHRLAQRELRRSGPPLTISATTLLHEAYLNLQHRDALAFPDRPRFLAYAARAMRGLVIDFARGRQALKRGGAFEITSLPTDLPQEGADFAELERLGEAIDRLARVDPHLAQIVDLKYFSGFSFTDLAATWDLSERTVRRDWQRARLFLHRALLDAESG